MAAFSLRGCQPLRYTMVLQIYNGFGCKEACIEYENCGRDGPSTGLCVDLTPR